MDNVTDNYLELQISSDKTIDENTVSHNLTIKITNRSLITLYDISTYIFVIKDQKIIFSQNFSDIPVLSPSDEVLFDFNYPSEANDQINFFARAFYRADDQIIHNIVNSSKVYPNDEYDYLSDNHLVDLFTINKFNKILNVTPITKNISFCEYGIIVNTNLNITYSTQDNTVETYDRCTTTLLRSDSFEDTSRIRYGEYSIDSCGNSIYLEIPLYFD